MNKIIYIILLLFMSHTSKSQLFELSYCYGMDFYKGEYNALNRYNGGSHSIGGLYTTYQNTFGGSVSVGAIRSNNIGNPYLPSFAKFTNNYQQISLIDEYHFIKFHPAMNGSGFTPVLSLSAGAQHMNVEDNWELTSVKAAKQVNGWNFWLAGGIGFKMALGRFIIRSNYSYLIQKNKYIDGVDLNGKSDKLSRVNIGIGYMFNAGSDCTQKRLTGNYFKWGDKF